MVWVHTNIHTERGILFSFKKEWDSGTCYNMNLNDIMLSETSQTQKYNYYMILLIWGT